jgi:hypothetical protein
MLSAADLNDKFEEFANEILIPKGFRKSGIHYFKKTDKEYFAIIKNTSRGLFWDYYLCYCHYGAQKQFQLLEKKPSAMLKDYPVSIAITDLEIVYNNSKTLLNSSFYFYSLSRQFKVDRNCDENESSWNAYFPQIILRNEKLNSDRQFLDNYIQDLFDKINKYGFKFFEECSVDLCFKSVKRAFDDKKMSQYSEYYKDYIESFEKYYGQNNIERPRFNPDKRQNWLGKLFSQN